MKKVLYIGLDVHKETIAIATAAEGRQPAKEFKTIPSDYTRLLKAVRLLTPKGGSAVVCYEAGPTGYGLYRRLHEAGIDCRVVAPSLVPTKAGNRVKTDRRDAVRLAHYLRSGDLTDVYVPDEADEALRDLERARDGAKRAERTARHQLGKFLLRYDRRFDETKNWTVRHMAWVRRQKFEHEAQQRVLTDYIKTVEDAGERVDRLTNDIEELVESSALAPLIKALQAFRGISLVSSATIACEVGDLRRFATAGQFMSYVGLVPSESSSGERRRQGSITRAGNGHLRRILVEAAWHYRRLPAMSKEIRRRNKPVADGVRRIAWEAQKRLHKRMFHLIYKGKNNKTAVIAVARELAGFIWAVAQEPKLLAT
ncbi:MAG: IS110 family transposase [Pseudomonadota bacterium]|nr:IS110 family transposase [Pseudomonadota bacterium]